MAATATKPAEPAQPVSRLAMVKRARIRGPKRILFYGPGGVGKTTLVASIPDSILADIEGGSADVEASRYPFSGDPEKPGSPKTYQDVLDMVNDLGRNPHNFKTLVIDGLDALESLLWRHMLERDSSASARNKDGKEMTSIEDYGYGKGYQIAVEEWRAFAALLDRLRAARGMDVVICGHGQVKPYKNPEGEDYDRYVLKINGQSAAFLGEWVDVMAYYAFEEGGARAPGSGKNAKAKGWATGKRVLRLQRGRAHDAKTRVELPAEILIDVANPWGAFARALDEAYTSQAPKLRAAIDEELNRIGDDELRGKVVKSVKDAGEDTTLLQKYLHNLQAKPAKEETKS